MLSTINGQQLQNHISASVTWAWFSTSFVIVEYTTLSVYSVTGLTPAVGGARQTSFNRWRTWWRVCVAWVWLGCSRNAKMYIAYDDNCSMTSWFSRQYWRRILQTESHRQSFGSSAINCLVISTLIWARSSFPELQIYERRIATSMARADCHWTPWQQFLSKWDQAGRWEGKGRRTGVGRRGRLRPWWPHNISKLPT